MALSLYNSLGRKKEPFTPRVAGQVGIYVCGITAYDYCHIGHARVMVSFDVLVRHLRASGLKVTHVCNFTDIDDKIIRRAIEEGIAIDALTTRFIAAFHEDMAALGVNPADIEPKATEHLPEMRAMIQTLIDKGLAYESGGDVFYAVDRFPAYGRLSGKHLEDLESGARVEVDGRKANPLDFVLWKGAKPGEPHWPSPWGDGRPGWHIECSAMGVKYLGESFDLHGGGRDLIFPHHENEIAQTEGATGKPWVTCWLHNGFVNVVDDQGNREKMSKSLDNFRTIRDLLTAWRGEAIRLFLLGSHYRAPLDFSLELLDAARAGLDRLYVALRGAKAALGGLPEAAPIAWEGETGDDDHASRFREAMDDDLNTPRALAVLYDLAKAVNRSVAEMDGGVDPARLRQQTALLLGLGAILGVCGEDPELYFKSLAEESDTAGGLSDAEVEARIAARAEARRNRDFQAADRIRAELAEAGIILEDARGQTTWRREA
ncbi:Cysteine--tRNA ligase [Candidatus Magnetaquicoccaceae bacterium FCR-1]|uniref:Cysteine--tRNA ligase n=1 Tax=Candidatus Magnetaquiglobus chichijimensis TaxID=3141448 RepID=A0ABQ0CDD6_9PROT